MAKTWVLETHTKGTGANVVPLDAEREQPARAPERPLVVRKPKPQPAPAPEPRRPSRFRVVEVTTHRVLADDAGARETVAALRDVRSVVDVAVSVWDHERGRWRLLTHGEQRALWDLRHAGGRPASDTGGSARLG